MLIKNELSRLPHFVHHPEMLPFSGSNGVLIVSECTNFKGDFFADKSDAFMDWYENYTPKHFEGLTDKEWRLTNAQCSIQQIIMRNYDKHANPDPPIPFE